ncbi:hypothetical protein [Embleya sp. NBC_00896]|uniref:hypothetical protein n=1 Tax=Embleya sp. NBC_00896 TaxID=2975961 RepID=UPI003870C212|nr:hypothetical protein OG928_05160 [Embleya sp. NBC_00896]
MSPTAPVPRPPAPSPRTLGLRATLVVAVVMLLLILIPYLLNHSVVGAAPVRAGQVVTLGTFRYSPAPGWQIDRGASQAGLVSVLVKGATTYRLTPLGKQSSAASAFKAAERRYEATGRGRVGADPAPVTTAGGLTGQVASISGNTVAGTLTVLVGGGQGLGVTLTARHTAPLTAAIADDVVTMLDSVEVVGS